MNLPQVLTGISHPLKHKTFGTYFTESWMNVLLISLHNMFSMIISAIVANKALYMHQMKLHAKLAKATDILSRKGIIGGGLLEAY